jgi:cytochrome c553
MKKILSIATILLLAGCSDQSQKDVQEVSQKVQNVDVEKVIEKATKSVSESNLSKIIESAKESANTLSEAVQKTDLSKVIESAANSVEKATAITVAKSDEVAKNIKEEVNKALDSVQKAPIDGSALFGTKCASCHGAKAEKNALGKSQVIAGWSSDKIHTAINGYKDGNYGGIMKGVMAGQAKALKDDQIDALADFISKQ